jgi:hypothetical protein
MNPEHDPCSPSYDPTGPYSTGPAKSENECKALREQEQASRAANTRTKYNVTSGANGSYGFSKQTLSQMQKNGNSNGNPYPSKRGHMTGGSGFSFTSLFGKQKKAGKSTKRKSSTRKSKRTQKRC